MLLSILFFFIITIGWGFLVDIILDWKADFFEKFIIRLGIGLTLIPIVGVFFNIVKIPLDWKIFLILAILITGFAFYSKKNTLIQDLKIFFNFKKITKSQIYYILLLIMFGITAYMYIHGSFINPWFENGDPYSYSLASKYIALEKTYSAPYYFTHFSEPYAQGYQILMGLLHQTNNSIYWNMKFFHNLIISLSVLFFFFFVRRLTKNKDIAIISTFALFAVPAWFSHFIFSLTFNMTIMFIFFYSLFLIEKEKKWKYFSIIFFASLWITHFYTAMIITALFVLYYLIKVFTQETFNKEIIQVGFFGILSSLIIFWIPEIYKYRELIFHSDHPPQLGGLDTFFPTIYKILTNPIYLIIFILVVLILFAIYFLRKKWFPYLIKILQIKNIKWKIYLGLLIMILLILLIPSEKIIYAKGSATRHYTLGDFFMAKGQNMINNPVGIGLILMSLFIIGIIFLIINYKKLFKKENFWLALTFTWSIFTLIGVLGYDFSIGFVPFRMWTFFAIPLSIIVGFTMLNILKLAHNFKGTLKYTLLAILIILFISSVYATSFKQKYELNTAFWPEHQIMVPESQKLYIWMRENLPKNSRVTNICHKEYLTIGYDMLSKPWLNKELAEVDDPTIPHQESYYKSSLNKPLVDNYNFLKRNNFDYVAIGSSCIAKFKIDPNVVNNRLQEFLNSTNFNLIYNTKSEFLFKVN